jgi:hypothetical protein
METLQEKIRTRVKEKLRKQGSAISPLLINPLLYGALGAGVGGLAGGIRASGQGIPFEYGFEQGMSPGMKTGAITGGLMGLGPALARMTGKPVPAYNPITAMNLIPVGAGSAMSGWGSVPSYGG